MGLGVEHGTCLPRFPSPPQSVSHGAPGASGSHLLTCNCPLSSFPRFNHNFHEAMSSRTRQQKAQKLARLEELKRAREGGKRTYKVRVHAQYGASSALF